MDASISVGDFVRHRTWTPPHVGTIKLIDGDEDLYVAWHGSLVEDQISAEQVERLTDEEKATYIAAQPPGFDNGYAVYHRRER